MMATPYKVIKEGYDEHMTVSSEGIGKDAPATAYGNRRY